MEWLPRKKTKKHQDINCTKQCSQKHFDCKVYGWLTLSRSEFQESGGALTFAAAALFSALRLISPFWFEQNISTACLCCAVCAPYLPSFSWRAPASRQAARPSSASCVQMMRSRPSPAIWQRICAPARGRKKWHPPRKLALIPRMFEAMKKKVSWGMKASLRPFYLSDEMTKLPSLRVAGPWHAHPWGSVQGWWILASEMN